MKDSNNNFLITGASGFVGRHLSEHLLSLGSEVFGIDRVYSPHEFPNLYIGDMRDQSFVEKVLLETKPNVVFHLAGILKANDPQGFYTENILPTITLLESLSQLEMNPKFIIASSSAVYGDASVNIPISEDFITRPVTHYGVSKLALEAVALRYYYTQQFPVICTRTFNLLGPGLSDSLACSSFAKQIALCEKTGTDGLIEVGSLDAMRDFTDVRDAVKAYMMIAEKGELGAIYNICSESPVSIGECLEILLREARVKIEVRKSSIRFQKNDIPRQVGNAGRLKKLTGWKPEISLDKSLKDMLEHWRKYYSAGAS